MVDNHSLHENVLTLCDVNSTVAVFQNTLIKILTIWRMFLQFCTGKDHIMRDRSHPVPHKTTINKVEYQYHLETESHNSKVSLADKCSPRDLFHSPDQFTLPCCLFNP